MSFLLQAEIIARKDLKVKIEKVSMIHDVVTIERF